MEGYVAVLGDHANALKQARNDIESTWAVQDWVGCDSVMTKYQTTVQAPSGAQESCRLS